MECNKDEAIRAKQKAEEKMENKDFEGARKIVVKAQNLYPELENISQLLSICDVHCAAQKALLGSEKDWYGILQVEKLADELTVKKQYRRLALFLHPDKNRFPGAEAAFKLICEANAVLSDPSKKSLYDSKIRGPVRPATGHPPPHYMNRNSQFNKQYAAQNKFSYGFTSLNQHQTTQSSSSVRQDVFWTSCPFCSIKYQYDRKFINTSLRCQKCLKNFMTYEISVQNVPLGSKWVPLSAQQVPARHGMNQSAGFQEKQVPDQGKFTMGLKSDTGSSASHLGSQSNASKKTVRPRSGIRIENAFVGSAAKETYDCNVNSSRGVKEGVTCNGDAKTRETRNPKNKSQNRGRNHVESSESYDSSSESDLEDVTMKNINSEPSYVHFPRRSSRKRQNVSYNEGDDDDLPSSLRSPQGSKLSGDDEHGQKDALNGEYSKNERQNNFPTDADYSKSESEELGTVHPEESAGHDKEVKAKGEARGRPDHGPVAIEIESDSDRDSFSRDNSDKGLQYDDPEFNDFAKDRDESCFDVNQLWACYDTRDGMPRFYAKVKKVCASPFELRITWLEADAIDEAQKKWIDVDLPVGCGSFKLGKTDKTSLQLSFSHQIHLEKGRKRGSLIIYPRKGEVWALFKHWDLSWSSDPENHQEYKYEIVEVLSDFAADAGNKVCYLDKVGGFVSLFQRNETDYFLIGHNELYKFSHRIPSFKMSGLEREGVPVGSFELDPAALPLNPDDLHYPGKVNMETQNMDLGR